MLLRFRPGRGSVLQRAFGAVRKDGSFISGWEDRSRSVPLGSIRRSVGVLRRYGSFRRSDLALPIRRSVLWRLGSNRGHSLAWLWISLRLSAGSWIGLQRRESFTSLCGVFAGLVQITHPLVVIMLAVSRSSVGFVHPLVVFMLAVSRSRGPCSSYYYVISISCQLARKFIKSDISPHISSHPISHTNSPPSTTDFHGDSHGYLYKVKITYQEEYGCFTPHYPLYFFFVADFCPPLVAVVLSRIVGFWWRGDGQSALLAPPPYHHVFWEPGEIEAEFAQIGTARVMKEFLTYRHPGPLFLPKGKGFGHPPDAPIPLPSWLSEDDVNYYASFFEKKGFTGGINYYRNMDRNWELTAPWTGAQIKVPVKFIVGDQDLVYNSVGGKDFIHKGVLKKYVPFLEEVVVMEGVAHFINEERPTEISEHIHDFIKKF